MCFFLPTSDKQNKAKNLGTFMSSPQKVGESIQLVYQNGDSCLSDKKIKTVIMLVCKPGENIAHSSLPLPSRPHSQSFVSKGA